MTDIYVTKRDGRVEPLDIEKLHKVVNWACAGLSGVSVSDIEMKSQIQFSDKIRTDRIQSIMIKAAGDLITATEPNYQYVAARLMLFDLRKKVLGQYEPIHLKQLVDKNVAAGVYDPIILENYTHAEFDQLNAMIKHERDLTIAYAGMQQMASKYLVRDRATDVIYETPQYAFIMVAATIFAKYPTATRLSYVKKFYDHVSKFNITLPTPIIAGVRTPVKQYASCVLIECGDSINSITATTGAIIKYISQKAGIGIGASNIRSLGSKIGSGQATHTGVVPFYKLFESAVSSCCLTPDTIVEILDND